MGRNIVIYELKQFCVLVFFTSENESTDGEDTDIEINGPDGTNGTVKVKVLTFSENVAHSEDEEG